MKHLRQEHGYSMLLAIVVIVLISVIGLGLLTMNTNSLKASKNETVDQSIYYIAEAGLNLEKAKLLEELDTIIKNLLVVFNNEIKNNNDLPANIRKPIDFFTEKFKSNFKNKSYAIVCGHTNTKEECISPPNFHQQFNQQFNQQPIANAQVNVECNNNECTYTITAHGYYSESASKKRSLSQELTVELEEILSIDPPDPDSASPILPITNLTVVTSGNIALEGSATIYGNAASGGIVTLSGGTAIPGNLAINPGNLSYPTSFPAQSLPTISAPVDLKLKDYLPGFPETDFNKAGNLVPPNAEVVKSEYNKTYIIKDGHFSATNWMTNGYELNLNSDTYFKSFNVSQNNTITINTGNKDVNIYVDKLDITQGHIKITGTGKLNILVKDSVNIKGSFNNNGNPGQATIYYQGASSVMFSNETSLYGSFYTNTADLTLTGGAALKGNIYSGGKNITISGGVPTNGQYIIAPNADLKLLEGGKVTGTVVAKSIYANGGTSINYGASVIPLPVIPGDTPKYNLSEDFLTELSMVEI